MDKEKVLDYLTYTPNNTNWAVLKGMTGDSEELYEYITKTPYNINRAVVGGILDRIDGGDTPSGDESEVGTAKVGTAKVASEEERTK